MHVSDLDTPALVVDLDVMERNLERVADYAQLHDLRLRPHTKTHKIPALGRRQIELGAAGLTVAKTTEAEVMAASGTPDLLVAYPVIGSKKLERLIAVASKTRVTVALDSEFAARALSDAAAAAGVTFTVLAEVDAGFHRVGVGAGETVPLAKAIDGLPNLTFEGIIFYPGHIEGTEGASLVEMDRISNFLGEVMLSLRDAGLACPIVSGGSTPTLFESHRIATMNEIRPGTYIFNDKNTVASGGCTYEDCAASIIVTVVSTAVTDQIIVDGGTKTFSSDQLMGGGKGFGHIPAMPGAVFKQMNEEHGYIDIRRAENVCGHGGRLRIIPNHICAAVNLHEKVYGIRGGIVEETWKVEGRGKLQ